MRLAPILCGFVLFAVSAAELRAFGSEPEPQRAAAERGAGADGTPTLTLKWVFETGG